MSRFLFEGLRGDLRDAWRSFRRDRGVALVATAILAAVLAANTVLFTFLSAFLWRPLPIAAPERHVEVESRDRQGGAQRQWPLADVEALQRAGGEAFEHVYGVGELRTAVQVPGASEPEPAAAEVVAGAYFQVARPRVARGRGLATSGPEAERAEMAALLSDAGWRRLTLSDPHAIGRSLLVNGTAVTVVGIADSAFTGLEPITPDFWLMAPAAAVIDAAGPSRPPRTYRVAGVLRPGVSPAQAEAVLTAILAPSAASAGGAGVRVIARLRPTRLRERDEVAPLAWTLLVAFALVGLVACANLTSMHMARAASRSREIAIRLAVGATRARLVRQLVTESVGLALVADAAGALTAVLAVGPVERHVFSTVASSGLTLAPVDVDWRVFAYSAVLAIAFGLASGLVPALQATRLGSAGMVQALAIGGTTPGSRRPFRLRKGLVVAQTACSVALLVAAGLLLRGAGAAAIAPIGYDAARLIDVGFPQPTAALRHHLERDPRLMGVTAVMATPLAGQTRRVEASVDGARRTVGFNFVDDAFFDVLRIPVRRGRTFTLADTANRVPQAVVSESTARRLWPGRDPLGRVFGLIDPLGLGNITPVRYEVVGVAADVVSGWFFQGPDATMIYLPAAVGAPPVGELVVRARYDVPSALRIVREACRTVDPAAPCGATTLGQLLGRQQVPFAIAAQIAAVLGALALVLACVGLYGLVSYGVLQRTREIGIRLAVGATPGAVLRRELASAVRTVGVGIAIGLPACAALAAVFASKVVMLDALDPLPYVVTPLSLLASGAAAALVPAARAAAVDPLETLRHD